MQNPNLGCSAAPPAKKPRLSPLEDAKLSAQSAINSCEACLDALDKGDGSAASFASRAASVSGERAVRAQERQKIEVRPHQTRPFYSANDQMWLVHVIHTIHL